jgi:uncharacterized protein (TIGR00266 family)
MEFKVLERPEFAWLEVTVPTTEKLFVEASSMAAMSSNISMRALFKGGLRRFLARESLFISEFTAHGGPGEVCIAPGPSGDMGHVRLQNESFYLASTCFVAHSQGLKYETKFQKLSQGLLSGMGWFLLKFSGSGDLWFNGYGQLVELEVGEDELLIDNSHIVGFTEGVHYELIKLGSYKSLFFSGEGFVCRFLGKGKVWIQTKKPQSLISWAHQYRTVQSKN